MCHTYSLFWSHYGTTQSIRHSVAVSTPQSNSSVSRTAVAEQLRPIVEEELSLIVGDDQQLNWTTTISHSLIDMQDKKSWLLSPYYKPESKEKQGHESKMARNQSTGRQHRTENMDNYYSGIQSYTTVFSKDQQIPGKKNATTGSLSKRTGPIAKKGGATKVRRGGQSDVQLLPSSYQ